MGCNKETESLKNKTKQNPTRTEIELEMKRTQDAKQKTSEINVNSRLEDVEEGVSGLEDEIEEMES